MTNLNRPFRRQHDTIEHLEKFEAATPEQRAELVKPRLLLRGGKDSAAQLALLSAVADGEVWLNADGNSELTDRHYFGLSDPVCQVTDLINEAEKAGWVVRPVRADKTWRLTADGRAALEPPS